MIRSSDDDRLDAARRLVHRLREGPTPRGVDFDACRAVLDADSSEDLGFQALCMLLEGALADAATPVDDAMVLVPLLKDLARGRIHPEELL